MQIEITHKFQKQVEGCNDRRQRSKVLRIIETVIASDNMNGFPNLKKLKGHKNSYRIRSGEYRIGIVIDGNRVIFAAFDSRSDIYKHFPWFLINNILGLYYYKNFDQICMIFDKIISAGEKHLTLNEYRILNNECWISNVFPEGEHSLSRGIMVQT